MKEALLNETLERLAQDAEGKKALKLAGPWIYVSDSTGDAWGVAAERRCMVWISSTLIEARPNIRPIPEEVARELGKYFWPKNEKRVSVDLAALRAFAGPPDWSVVCPECKGTSKDSDYVVCSFCDSDGITPLESRYGWLLDMPLNLTLLAPLLSVFRDDVPLSVTIEELNGVPSIFWLIQSDRHAVLMGMTPNLVDKKEKWEKASRFPE